MNDYVVADGGHILFKHDKETTLSMSSIFEKDIILVDVAMNGRIVTVNIYPTEKCNSILERMGLDSDNFYMLSKFKPLEAGRRIIDYDFPRRFSVEVLPILRGGIFLFLYVLYLFDVHSYIYYITYKTIFTWPLSPSL